MNHNLCEVCNITWPNVDEDMWLFKARTDIADKALLISPYWLTNNLVLILLEKEDYFCLQYFMTSSYAIYYAHV